MRESKCVEAITFDRAGFLHMTGPKAVTTLPVQPGLEVRRVSDRTRLRAPATFAPA